MPVIATQQTTHTSARAAMPRSTYSAMIRKEDDMYIANCPELGTVSQGYSPEEALDNLREASALWLEEFGHPTPQRSYYTTFEIEYA